MSEVTPDAYRVPLEDYFASQGSGEFSDADFEALLQQLQGEGPTEAELQDQFDSNFQTMSYLFMRELYAYADEQTTYY